ncbi:hypothetical protein RRG08_041538 [Elysia crispata]|uniref:Uncharacterized protein n=1 Tax=Elysia crispata TaxID=231223 RepID=A0AAE0ZUU5_9GAST|nr:hypothetical protein RRG08_041538 [Elysia crispata]
MESGREMGKSLTNEVPLRSQSKPLLELADQFDQSSFDSLRPVRLNHPLTNSTNHPLTISDEFDSTIL